MFVSFNCAQLPWPYNSLPNSDLRITAVCRDILEQPNILVVCFQELFRSSARRIVREMLGPRFPHMFLDESCGKYGVGVNSGLAIVSRLSLFNRSLREYTERRNVEYFSKKGLMGVRCTLPPALLGTEVSNLYIYTTHLQAGGNQWPLSLLNSKTADEIKHAQIREACEWIARDTAGDTSALILWGGDFNLKPTERPLDTIRASRFINAFDTFDGARSPLHYSNSRGDRIDYWFALRAPLTVQIFSTLNGSLLDSDHVPVYAHIL